MRILGQLPAALVVEDPPTGERVTVGRASGFEPWPAAPAPAPTPRPAPAIVYPHPTTTIVYDLHAETYRADPCERPSLNASTAGVLDRQSPLHAHNQHPRLGGKRRRPTASLDAGKLIHALLLGEEHSLEVIEAPNYKTKAAKQEFEDATAAGRIPVLLRDYDEARGAAGRLREQFDVLGFPLDGASEVSAFWTEEADDGTEVQCRGRIDHLRGLTLIDLKSCRSAHPDALAKHVDTYGYAIQRAAYVSGLEKILGAAGRVDFVFLFLELEAPFAVTPVRLNGEFRELGERKWRRAVNAWARCAREDVWPGYAGRVLDLAPPHWAMANDLERECLESGAAAEE